ncbi:hypothetical protein LAC80_37515 (plasmid) [Ensifer adhaerens]|nr:hypothetical protein [Ensifer adhaerens]MBZ7927637.1 hypothetical protein [Ensifer adhaerens]UAX98035.1 hypothetical protein LAC78_38800 [Ensifer adhaerens]UAY05416.1 hypothetical protein LAC80_37515 [Ensifer adhaerens]
MKDTDRKAKAGMAKFVVTITALALFLAAIYVVFWTPGATEKDQPVSRAPDQSNGPDD